MFPECVNKMYFYFYYIFFSSSLATHIFISYRWSRPHSFPYKKNNVSCCIWKFTSHCWSQFYPISWVPKLSVSSISEWVSFFLPKKPVLFWFNWWTWLWFLFLLLVNSQSFVLYYPHLKTTSTYLFERKWCMHFIYICSLCFVS